MNKQYSGKKPLRLVLFFLILQISGYTILTMETISCQPVPQLSNFDCKNYILRIYFKLQGKKMKPVRNEQVSLMAAINISYLSFSWLLPALFLLLRHKPFQFLWPLF